MEKAFEGSVENTDQRQIYCNGDETQACILRPFWEGRDSATCSHEDKLFCGWQN